MTLRSLLRATCGPNIQFTPLSGLSGQRVCRVQGRTGSTILKLRPSPVERHFYQVVAPQLPGVPVPQLLACTPEYLLIEHLPYPFPEARQLADPEQLHILATLHRSQPVFPANVPLFRLCWTASMTEKMLQSFPGDAWLARTLHAVQKEAQPWLEGSTPVSGDPNPRNWGLRADGSLVLFDWERFALASPALDLAITVPGLGDTADFRQVAKQYVQVGGHGEPDALARGMALMKVWTLVEFLTSGKHTPARQQVRARLRAALPGWLRDVL